MIKLAVTETAKPAIGGVPAYPQKDATGKTITPKDATTGKDLTSVDDALPIQTSVPNKDLGVFVAKIGSGVVNVLLYIAGALAVIYMIYNGMQLILSGGDESKLATAKKNFVNGLIGVAVITLTFFLAYLIRNSIVTT